jgi:hypothetical protein
MAIIMVKGPRETCHPLHHIRHQEKENENGKFQTQSRGVWLVVLLILCEAVAIILPGWQITHGWLMLFSTAAPGSLRNLIDGVIFSAFFGWVTAAVLVLIYNRLAGR